MAIHGPGFGAIATYLVNGVDDRVDAAVATIAAGDFSTSLQAPSSGLRNLLVGAPICGEV